MAHETSQPIRFEQDTVHHSYDPVYANRFWRILLQVGRVLTASRCGFIGKASPLNFFWGSLDLAPLADTRHYFPPYDAVPVVRTASMLREPAIGRALSALAGRVSDRDMRRLNAAVDIERRNVKDVVREFLASLR